MEDASYLALKGKVEELERRIKELERRSRLTAARGNPHKLLEIYPFMMSKTQAAEVLGVTRSTIYNMIKDGRLDANPVGKIPTRSVIDFMMGNQNREL